jgi:hypothetical protein
MPLATDGGGGKTDAFGVCVVLVVAFLIVTNYMLWSASRLPSHHNRTRVRNKHVMRPMSQLPRNSIKRPVSDDGTCPHKRVRFADTPPAVQYTNEYFGKDKDEELKRGTLVDRATSAAKQSVFKIANALGPGNIERFIPSSVTERKKSQLDAIRAQHSVEAYGSMRPQSRATGKRLYGRNELPT